MYMSSRVALKAMIASSLIAAAAYGDPSVANVTAAQRQDNSRRIDIHYDLASTVPCTVWFVVSANGGANWNIPAMTFTGDAGPNVPAGTGKTIVWDAGADIPGKVGNFKVRVYADDGLETDMVVVPSGTFPFHTWNNQQQTTYLPSYLIDKYEVTNQRYCEFLNSADQTGAHWDQNMEISRIGSPPEVVYTVNAGKQHFPVRWVSALDADAYAVWRTANSPFVYRLPTEYEWQKAGAWDSIQSIWYPFGMQNNPLACNTANHRNHNYPSNPCVWNTSEVGSYNGNNETIDSYSFFGCYDITGNVAEWTSTMESPGNPATRVYLGGSWMDTYLGCYTNSRGGLPPDSRTPTLGFRLVRELP